jgi:hypothetical protein
MVINAGEPAIGRPFLAVPLELETVRIGKTAVFSAVFCV